MRSRRLAHLVVALLGTAALLAACGDDTESASTGDDATTTSEADVPDDTDDTAPGDDDATSTSSTGSAPTGVAQAAVDDLAERLGVDASQITIVSSDAVTWSDSSVGCPRKGFMYQQVLTEGTRTILEVDGTRYQYHSGGTSQPFLCETPQEPQSMG